MEFFFAVCGNPVSTHSVIYYHNNYHSNTFFPFSPLQVDVSKVTTLCKLFQVLLMSKGGPDLNMDPAKLHPLICTTFVFCYLWSIGGNITENYWDAFDTFVRQVFDDHQDAKVM